MVVDKTWTGLTGQTRVSGLQAKPGFGFLGLGFAFSTYISPKIPNKKNLALQRQKVK